MEALTMESPQKRNLHDIGLVDSQSNFLNPSAYLGLEDIEPAWMENTASFSESSGSCFSRISSLSVDGKPSDSLKRHLVPDTCGIIECAQSEKLDDETPFRASGSLQSLCSSSKTVYASPRSNSEDQLFCPHNDPSSTENHREIYSRHGKFRERAPSETALDFNSLKRIGESKLSHSLHDVSSIPSNGLKNPSKQLPVGRSSFSSLYLRNRSRDSGFMRSESLLSLSSGGRNYDHVESKVKHYIQSIKTADALRRKERAQSKTLTVYRRKQTPEENNSQPLNDAGLVHIVEKMQNEMAEKDRLLLKLQEDYNCLLGKYAEAENKIDKLRFGWHENVSLPATKNQSPSYSNQRIPFSKLVEQSSALQEIDESSLTSSMFLSHFESAETPNSSFQLNNEWSKHNRKEGRKEIIISAPLRPISSLYCTSVRLDRTVTPLNSKSSVEASSSSSSQNQFVSSSNSKEIKQKQAMDITLQEGTTDTGISSFFHDGMSATPLPLKSEPMGHLPNEDPISKVQRWQQRSLCTPHSEFSPCYRGNKNSTKINSSFESMQHGSNFKPKKRFCSIGVQVNLANSMEFSSSNSRMSTPIVPLLCLGEVSGCTDSSSQLDSEQSGKFNSTAALDSKSFSSNRQMGSNAGHVCEGQCTINSSNDEYCHTFRETKGQPGRAVAQMSGPELSKLSSLILKDQDHVVPASPEDERSVQHTFKILEKKINTLKSSVNLHTFVSLLDMLLDKLPSNECQCQCKQNVPTATGVQLSPIEPKLDSSAAAEFSDIDGSLLKCLEELDEYTNQVWAKTESFLEVLNSNKCSSSMKHK